MLIIVREAGATELGHGFSRHTFSASLIIMSASPSSNHAKSIATPPCKLLLMHWSYNLK